MSTFNIWGTCVCRDIFGIADLDNKHKINVFLQGTSQFVQFGLGSVPSNPIQWNDFSPNIVGFQRKCILNDYNYSLKNTFFSSQKSDFFLMDLTSMVVNNVVREQEIDGKIHYFTHSGWFKNAYKNGLNQKLYGCTLETIDRFDLLEKYGYKDVINRYVDWLTSELGYKGEQIICIVNKKNYFWHNDEKIHFFDYDIVDKENKWLDEIYNYFEQVCKGCHMIYTPYGTLSDPKHKWGLHPLHSDKSLYDYYLNSIEAVMQCDEKSVFRFREELSWKNMSLLAQNLMRERSIDISFPNLKRDKYFGDKLEIGNGWSIINYSTVISNNNGDLVISRRHNRSTAQTNLVKTIRIDKHFEGELLFSVWTKAEPESKGTIGIINNVTYGRGHFLKKKVFTNNDWQQHRIKINVSNLADNILLCLRTNVEDNYGSCFFRNPKLYIL